MSAPDINERCARHFNHHKWYRGHSLSDGPALGPSWFWSVNLTAGGCRIMGMLSLYSSFF
jgi:hypothetical protein